MNAPGESTDLSRLGEDPISSPNAGGALLDVPPNRTAAFREDGEANR